MQKRRRQLSGVVLILALMLLLGACADDRATSPTDDGDGPNNQTDPNNRVDDGNNAPLPPESDPGRVTLHRLNRAEYNNTVRDLTGTELRPADDFPADDHGYGFDNIADVLSLSPLQIELYDRAAEMLVAEALEIPLTEPESQGFEAEEVGSETGGRYQDSAWNLWSNGTLESQVDIPQTGQYRISAGAFGQQAGPDPAAMVFLLDGQEVGRVNVESEGPNFETYSQSLEIEAGAHTIGVAFVNDFYEPENNADRNLIVDWFGVEGPFGVEDGVNPLRERLVTCNPDEIGVEACAREILGSFVTRAWRRPIEEGEMVRMLDLVNLPISEGDTFDDGLSLAMQAALLSPHFLFRVELDPDPTSLEPHKLTDYELATRLSYFIWSSMPDDELFEAAARGGLNNAQTLTEQVERMLADEKAFALVENFSGQWLFTAALNDVNPDYNIYPDWDDELKEAMRMETQQFFWEFLQGDTSAWEMFTADFTYLNDRLARHYGMDPVGSDQPVRMELSDPQRGGILTHGSVQTVTSYPTRTSPVIRGKWILSQLLCTEPPPPPPGVEGLVEEEIPTGTLRERLEQHRADPTCAACHALMDPLGFGMENYNGIGAWRDEDTGGFPIDSSGELDDGTTFNGVGPLSQILAEDERFVHCLSEKMFTYALGRGPVFADKDDLEFIREGFMEDEARLQSLVKFIAHSDAFRYRRGEPEEQAGE